MADRRWDGRFSAVRMLEFRRAERRECEIPAGIVTAYGETGVVILNVSAGGLALRVDPLLTLKPGERITVKQDTLGEVRCTVRWGLHPRYGVQFDPPGSTPNGALELFESLSARAETDPPHANTSDIT